MIKNKAPLSSDEIPPYVFLRALRFAGKGREPPPSSQPTPPLRPRSEKQGAVGRKKGKKKAANTASPQLRQHLGGSAGSARIGRGWGGGNGSPVWCYWADLAILGGMEAGMEGWTMPASGGESSQGWFCDAGFQLASAGRAGTRRQLLSVSCCRLGHSDRGDRGGPGGARGWCWCPPECPHCAGREGAGSAGSALAPPRHAASMGTPGNGERDKVVPPQRGVWRGGREGRGNRRGKRSLKKRKRTRSASRKCYRAERGLKGKGKTQPTSFVCCTWAVKMEFCYGDRKKKPPWYLPPNANFIPAGWASTGLN